MFRPYAVAAFPLLLTMTGCAGVTAPDAPAEPGLLPDSGVVLLGGVDGGAPASADGSLTADTVLPAQGCALSPHGLSRFPQSQRRTASGRVFSGWGGTPGGGKPGRLPLVLIPGNGETANRWLDLRRQLCAMGYSDQELWAITFKQPSCFGICLGGSNTQHAVELELFIKLVLKQTQASRVNIVAVSMGVAATRHYLKFRGGLSRNEVSMAYLISGPNHGTPLCDLPGATVTNVACAEVSTLTLLQGWLHDLNTPDETPQGQNQGLPPGQSLTYRTVTYGLDPAFPGIYASSPQLKGADNLVLAGAKHAVVPFQDLWAYLAKTVN